MAFNTYILLSNDKFITWFLDLEDDITWTFKLWAIVVISINTVLSYIYEKIVIWQISLWWKTRKEKIKHER